MERGGMRILVADSDISVRETICAGAGEEGFICDQANNGIAALKLFRHNEYNLVVLEAELPELDGRIVCRQIRKLSTIPIIFISRITGETERLAAFAAGGNDYVVKPFSYRELTARIISLISLYGHRYEAPKAVEAGKLRIELLSRGASIDGKAMSLAPKEYELLLFFCRNPSKAFSRGAILDHVWGEDFFGTDRTVDTHIKSLRGKLGQYHGYIVTIWGVGYKFEVGIV